MPDVIEEDDIYPLVVSMAGELERQLRARNLPLRSADVLPEGLAVLDFFEDECDGYAWVRVGGSFPYRQFPVPDPSGASCSSPLAFELEVGYAHCAPSYEPGEAPSSSDQLAAARDQLSAMAAMRSAIRAVLESKDRQYSLGVYQALIAGGGVLGATWTITVADRNS